MVKKFTGRFASTVRGRVSGSSSLAESKKRFNASNVKLLCRKKPGFTPILEETVALHKKRGLATDLEATDPGPFDKMYFVAGRWM